MLRRVLFLGLACVMVGCSVSAQSATDGSRGDLELDLAGYKAELDRCAESIRQGENSAEIRESLPRGWVIQTGQSRIVVSTEWLASELRHAEYDPAKSTAVLREVQRRLSAMRKAAMDLEAESKAANPESARGHLEKILQRREFARASGPSQAELLEARIIRWIGERILRLLSLLHVGRTAGNVVTWTIIALAFAALCYWIWQNAPRALRDAKPSVQRPAAANEARQWAKEAFAAAERGETIVVTKNGRPVAKITPQSADRANDPEWRANFAALKKSLRSKQGSGFRLGTITEDDKYGNDAG